MTRPDLDAIMERQRDSANSVDRCIQCDTPLGRLDRVTVDLAVFLGCHDRAVICAPCREDAAREMDADLTAFLNEPEEPAPTLPMDLDGAALRALRSLCGVEYAARIAWSRWGVTVALVSRAGTTAQSTAPTIAEAVEGCAVILGRDVPEVDAARAALGRAPTMAPPTNGESV